MYSLLAIQTSGAPLTPQPPSWVYQPSFLSSSPYVGKFKKATTKEKKEIFLMEKQTNENTTHKTMGLVKAKKKGGKAKRQFTDSVIF